MTEITDNNFGEEVKKFFGRDKSSFMMIRSDRKNDPQEGRYKTDEERYNGDLAMRRWFEYLFDKNIKSAVRFWVAQLRAGRPVMVVCPDPADFDLSWIPNPYPSTPPRFFDKLMKERGQWQEELSEEHRAMMRQRFADLLKDLRAAPEACTPRTCPRKYGQECPREDRRWCRSSDELVERGFGREATRQGAERYPAG